MSDEPVPAFTCDAMLGSLARWLRAAGYDAVWEAGIDDWELLRRARQQGLFVLSSDTGIFRIGLVRDGDLPALFVPHGLSTQQQLAFVLGKLNLSLRPPRCMACGGALDEVPREVVQAEVPPHTLATADRFWRCERCTRVFWHGTHWQRIDSALQRLGADGGPSKGQA